MSLTLTVEIPALERLCGILEDRNRENVMAEIQQEIVRQLEDAAKQPPTPNCERCAEYVTATEAEALPQPPAATAPSEREPQEVPKPEPEPEPESKPEPEPEPKPEAAAVKPVTLEQVQRAAAQLRDEGKLKAVTAMFPEFGIKKLSDLEGDKLQAFAERMRGLGAKL